MRTVKFAVVTMSVALLIGCAAPAPTMTPLEIQSIQTREFEAPKKVVFASTVSVFQDLGYTIEDADLDTGLVRAQGAADSSASTKFWTGMSKVNQTAATAFIEEIRGVSRVRLNFVEKVETSSAWGQQDREDKPILDVQVYQNAFERIENAVFVRQAN